MLLHCVWSYGSPELQVLLIAYLEWLQAPKKANKVYKARNPLLTRGVERYSRSQSYIRSGLLKVKSKKAIAKKAEPAAAAKRAPGFYPADDVRGKFRNNKKAKPTKLRASLTPGTVVIILAGRFRGKRAVFIKQLPSGMLLVNGALPFELPNKKRALRGCRRLFLATRCVLIHSMRILCARSFHRIVTPYPCGPWRASFGPTHALRLRLELMHSFHAWLSGRG